MPWSIQLRGVSDEANVSGTIDAATSSPVCAAGRDST